MMTVIMIDDDEENDDDGFLSLYGFASLILPQSCIIHCHIEETGGRQASQQQQQLLHYWQ